MFIVEESENVKLSCRIKCRAGMIQMHMLWSTLFLKREKKSSTECKPNKNEGSENGQENLLPEFWES